MEIFLAIIGVVLIFIGIVGCFVPVIPGPPLAYLALLLLQIGPEVPFSTKFMIILGVVVAAVTVLDYVVPALGAKKWGGSKYGIYGSFAGVFMGIFFWPPFGFLVFPFLGALIGEMIYGAETKLAMKSAAGTFFGLLFGTMLKLSVTLVIAYYFFTNL